jgi:aflatoxin B1 aldehyde reductase
VAFHSLIDGNHGDGIIIGATKIQQVTRTVAGLNKGPLGVDVAARIDDLWKMVEHEAPVDNFSKHIRFKKDSK